jgi:hypothetical protein
MEIRVEYRVDNGKVQNVGVDSGKVGHIETIQDEIGWYTGRRQWATRARLATNIKTG